MQLANRSNKKQNKQTTHNKNNTTKVAQERQTLIKVANFTVSTTIRYKHNTPDGDISFTYGFHLLWFELESL